MKLSLAAILVDIPDHFKLYESAFGSSQGLRQVFVFNKEYIKIFIRSGGHLQSREYGYIDTANKELVPDSRISGGPALYIYDNSGDLSSKGWLKDGQLHRDSIEGPALVKYNKDGSAYSAEYRNSGRLHRPRKRGPAVYYQRADGKHHFGFWEDGACIAEFEDVGTRHLDEPLSFFEDNCKKFRRGK